MKTYFRLLGWAGCLLLMVSIATDSGSRFSALVAKRRSRSSCDKKVFISRVRFLRVVPEADFATVREKNVGNVELFGAGAALFGCVGRIDRGALRFGHRHRTAMTVAKHIIGARAVRQRILRSERSCRRSVPADVLEQRVDNRA